MSHFPDFDTFQQLARDHHLVPVWRCLFSDALTPVTAFHRIDTGGSACLFESVIGGEKVGRYSFLAADPFLELSATRNVVSVVSGENREEYTADDPLEEIRKRLEGFKAAHLPDLPPFAGGAVGYASYDVVRYTEYLPNAPLDDRKLPDLCFGFYDHMAVFDNVSKTMFVIAMAHLDEDGTNAEEAFADATRRVDDLVERLLTPGEPLPAADIDTSGAPTITYESNFEQADFEKGRREVR